MIGQDSGDPFLADEGTPMSSFPFRVNPQY